MAPQPRTRLVDLAAHLELAPSTVSRALAGSHTISSGTRDRVRRAAREFGYTVNLAASGLKRGRTLNLGLIADMSYWYSGAVASGADRTAIQAGFDLVIASVSDSSDPDLLVQRARRLGQRVDGVLVNDLHEGPLLDALIDAVAVPVVTVGCQADGVSSVEVDNAHIAALAAEHLAGLGHVQAAVLHEASSSPLSFDNGTLRSEAFVDVFGPAAMAIELPPDRTAPMRRARILEITAEATAVFCATDELAIEVAAVLRSGGRAIPEHLSVVGVDDHPLAEPLGLTTVAQSPDHIGSLAVQQLVAELGDEADLTPQRVLVPVELRVRTSTGAV